jgi:hypothetical protein
VPSRAALIPGPAVGRVTPLGSRTGGHEVAQTPEHVEGPR